MKKLQAKAHKPKFIKSNQAYGPKTNSLTSQDVSESICNVTEVWNGLLKSPWKIGDVVIAQDKYKWITKWEKGKNYLITKFINENGELIGYYYDISSRIQKIDDHFQAYDWYLD